MKEVVYLGSNLAQCCPVEAFILNIDLPMGMYILPGSDRYEFHPQLSSDKRGYQN